MKKDFFECNQCGLCCQNLHLNPIYQEMHNGDGVCFHYDANLKLCKIYEQRPLFCNVEHGYQFFKDILDKQQYYDLNYQFCEQLKQEN